VLAAASGGRRAQVVVADIDRGLAEETSAEIRAFGQRSLPVQADLGELASIDGMIDTIASEMGGIDVAVNNAGVTRHGTLLEITEETWDLMFRINAKGTFFSMQRIAQQMVQQGRGGRIINVASTAGKGFRGTSSPAYAASKGAIISMTYIAAHQLAPHDINVNALKEGLEQMIPLGRLDEPEDVAAMAVFLAGPGGRNITGQTINIDGGLIMN
jgi:NAD(P)-dependent dehydrogenase (short-subunit alcohol dehydrogenase family)